jgi:hypothetical protein
MICDPYDDAYFDEEEYAVCPCCGYGSLDEDWQCRECGWYEGRDEDAEIEADNA